MLFFFVVVWIFIYLLGRMYNSKNLKNIYFFSSFRKKESKAQFIDYYIVFIHCYVCFFCLFYFVSVLGEGQSPGLATPCCKTE